jgi:chemotaxis protein CheX
MPKETVWAKRARKVRAAKTAQRAGSAERRTSAPGTEGETAPESDPPVLLPEVLDLPAISPLARELLARRGKPTVVDARAIQRPGAQCLQVLLAAIRTWERDGAPLRFINCGPLLVEHLRFLGVDAAPFLKGAQP